jgi:hypothetical protein
MATCLFCPNEIAGDLVSEEHVLPASICGCTWLTTYSVCRSCNSLFGSEVDKFADMYPITLLRREVGIEVNATMLTEYLDPQIDALIQGRHMPDGTIKPVSPVFKDGNRVVIHTETEEECQSILAKFTERQGSEFTMKELRRVQPRAVRSRLVQRDFERFKQLLAREAAKIAIEYIALVTAPEIAQLPALNRLRQFVRTGDDVYLTQSGLLNGPTITVLPNTGFVLIFAEPGKPVPEDLDAYLEAALPARKEEEPPDLTGLAEWPGYVHEIALIDDGRPRFELTLFSRFLAGSYLPSDLPLPWGTSSSLDVVTKEARGYRPRRGKGNSTASEPR